MIEPASAGPAEACTNAPTGAYTAAPTGAYTAVELDATAATIEAVQCGSGMIPWFTGGHGDPWNHVEAAMALTASGRIAAAERAYEWMAATQRPDGAWHTYYAGDGSVEEPRLDTNVSAYVAAGVGHHFLATADRGFLVQMWPVVERAVEWVLQWQCPGGELTWAVAPGGRAIWAVAPAGRPGSLALLSASSSVCTSLRGAIACAAALGYERPHWSRALSRLVAAVATRPWSFAPKDEFAMDWYYPVLARAIDGRAAERRLDRGWPTWVLDGYGVLCRSDGRWVTTAETAECAIACAGLGRIDDAATLLGWTRAQRSDDGSYATGMVRPEGVEFPAGERSTYSAAAVVLAADLLLGSPATVALFAPPPRRRASTERQEST